MTWYMGIDNMKVTDSLSLSLSLRPLFLVA
jgi:hypothetical protein